MRVYVYTLVPIYTLQLMLDGSKNHKIEMNHGDVPYRGPKNRKLVVSTYIGIVRVREILF